VRSAPLRRKILLFNRATQRVEEETVFKPRFMELCYGSRVGLTFTDMILKRRWFARYYGFLQRRPASKARIAAFIDRHAVDMSESLRPADSFACFNEFFIRQLKPEARPIDREPSALIAPADSRVLYFRINGGTVVPIKGKHFTIAELTKDAGLERRYRGGICLVFRLAPADYHRFCYIDESQYGPVRRIAGHFHSIHPLALATGVPILQTNYRELTVLETRNFGEVVHIDVGALAVGRIVQHRRESGISRKGEEKGYFEWGASTIVLLLHSDIRVDEDLVHYSQAGIETRVKYGSRVGRA
jgi:phosphatidylserine decarboxylase